MTSISAAPGRSPVGRAVGALLLGALAMGISPIFVRLADVGPFASAFWRVALALPLLWAWTRFDESAEPALRPRRDFFATSSIVTGLLFGADLFFWHLSVVHTTVANATFFAATAPVWVVVFGWLLFRQRVSRAVLLGMGLCLLGGLALVVQSMRVDLSRVPGDLYGAATGLFFGLYFLAVGSARKQMGAARVTFEMSVVAALLLFGIALALEPTFWPRSTAGWLALFAMSWVSHAGGQGLLSAALGRLPPVFSSLVIFLEAIAAALFAWALLGEPVTAVQALGGLIIVAGIWIARPTRTASP